MGGVDFTGIYMLCSFKIKEARSMIKTRVHSKMLHKLTLEFSQSFRSILVIRPSSLRP